MTSLVEHFVAESRRLIGTVVKERALWNTVANKDAIRHFAFGTSDDNPLWLDEDYARQSCAGGLLAPPGFVCSVLYPFLHGAPMDVPLVSLIGEISVEWFHPIRLNDEFSANARQLDVVLSQDRMGRQVVFIPAETTYLNQLGAVVAKATGTMVRIAREEGDLLLDRKIHPYDESQRASIRQALEREDRAGARSPLAAECHVGMPLKNFVRGPLSIGDMICWQAGIGPSYRGGSLGYFDTLASPHTTAHNPVTGWPLKYSQQHEDFLMAEQRGMPAPFDNSLMRFACLAPMLTDWMGDGGFLKKLSVQTGAPMLYGDTTWYRGIIVSKTALPEKCEIGIRITGVNQLGQTTTTASALVQIPDGVALPRPSRPRPRFPESHPVPNVLDLFALSVRARPDAPAVKGGGLEFSFAELDALSDQMAQSLFDAGAEAGSVIGLLFSRTPTAVAAILAILKTGATYLPLDPQASMERQRSVLEVAKPKLVFSSIEHAANGSRHGIRQVVWENGRNAVVRSFPRVEPTSTSLAYVMPTSGSLAEPRAVAVSHGSLGLYLDALQERFAVQPADRCLHSASFTFSASVRQLFGSLCVGSCLVLAGDQERMDVKLLLEMIRDERVTIWDTVPSVWQACADTLQMMSIDKRSSLLGNPLRMMLLTGETLLWKTPKLWRSLGGVIDRIFNLYSQTETAGTVCAYEITELTGDDDEAVPLGVPLAHCQVTLKDSGEDNEAGGEICVGGPRLASGYLGNPDLTAERFVLTAFQHGGVYRTGDLGRMRADGVFEFAGRSDLRVKIRGQRVEIGEVEAALAMHPRIREAAVSTFVSDGGSLGLIAYVVPDSDSAPPTTGDLLDYLRGKVADAALPARFLILETLPRTGSGKLNRSALPMPERQWIAPHEHEETVSGLVRQIFQQALETAHVNGEDNFFELGGNSLMATRVVSAIRERLGVKLPMGAFFDHPTILGVSEAVSEEMLRELEALSEGEAGQLLREATDVE